MEIDDRPLQCPLQRTGISCSGATRPNPLGDCEAPKDQDQDGRRVRQRIEEGSPNKMGHMQLQAQPQTIHPMSVPSRGIQLSSAFLFKQILSLVSRLHSKHTRDRFALLQTNEQFVIAYDVAGWFMRDRWDRQGQPASWDKRANYKMTQAKHPRLAEVKQRWKEEIEQIERELARMCNNQYQPIYLNSSDSAVSLDIEADADSLRLQLSASERAAIAEEQMPMWKVAYNKLNSEQRPAVDAFQAGRSIFLTGGGGTGKSFVLKTIIEWLKEKYSSPCTKMKSTTGKSDKATSNTPSGCSCYECSVAVIGPTGLSVLPLRGRTLNSYFGVGLGSTIGDWDRRPPEYLYKRIRNTKVLILDEVSMVSADVFDLMDLRMRIIRESTQPFGGIQLVVVGDFFQLPPIERYDLAAEEDIEKLDEKYINFRRKYMELKSSYRDKFHPGDDNENFSLFYRRQMPRDDDGRIVTQKSNLSAFHSRLRAVWDLYLPLPVRGWGFAYQSNVWSQLELTSIRLTKPMRFGNGDTNDYAEWLNQLRQGDVTNVDKFLSRVRTADGVGVHLMYINRDVVKCNDLKLRDLIRSTNQVPFRFLHMTLRNEVQFDSATSSQPASIPSSSNDVTSAQLLASARDVTDSDFEPELEQMAPREIILCTGAPVLLTRNLEMRPDQPLMLVNGSQGEIVSWTPLTGVMADIHQHIANIDAMLDRGEGNASGLQWKRAQLEAKLRFLNLGREHLPTCLPRVRFTGIGQQRDAQNREQVVSVERTILPEMSELRDVYDARRNVIVHKWRFQLPLRLGWALTVHKSQGMSLDAAFVKNDRSTFAYGQLYVAMSRVRSFEQLFLAASLNGKPNLWAHPHVKEFYRKLEANEKQRRAILASTTDISTQAAIGTASAGSVDGAAGGSTRLTIDWLHMTSHDIARCLHE